MSEDPETARQIAELSRDTRPLVVLDVDEVLLEFIGPFIGFLGSRGLKFDTSSFRLHGNVSEAETGAVVEDDRVSALLEDFFGLQADWQIAADGAAEAIGLLAAKCRDRHADGNAAQAPRRPPGASDRARLPLPAAHHRDPEGPGDPAVARRPSAPGRLRRRHRRTI